MDAVFYDYNGQKYVKIENGKTLFEEPIVIASPSGRYCVATGYWYINDEDSEDDGDEIEGSAETFVFENEKIIYRAKNLDDANDYVIQDDGKLYILEDDGISIWSVTGKPVKRKFSFSDADCSITDDYILAYGSGEDGNLRLSIFLFETGEFINKKFTFSELDCWITDEYFCAYGYGEDGNLRLSAFLFKTSTMWTKQLHADICNIELVFMVKDAETYDQSYIIALAETYENGTILIKYGIDGKKQELSRNDLVEIKSLLAAQKPATEETTEEVAEPAPVPTVQSEPAPAPTEQKVKKKGFLAKLFGK